MRLTSENFEDGDFLGPDHLLSTDFGFGCNGKNLSPQLSWSDAPSGTESFAITCYDPDAPTGSGFWHWIIVNLPADTHTLEVGAGNPEKKLLPPEALEVITDFGRPGYGGPCPPEGDNVHRYIFTVYAVGTKELPVDESTPQAMVRFMLNAHTIERKYLIGLAKR